MYDNARQKIDTGKDIQLGMRLTSYNDIGLYVIKFIRQHKTRISINRAKIEKFIRTYQMYYLKEELSDLNLFNQFI